jgi:peroxiredoxin
MRRTKMLRVFSSVLAAFIIGFTVLSCMGTPEKSSETEGADSATARAPASAEAVKPLGKGDMAPVAPVYTTAGEEVSLGKIYENGPTVLIFYRGGWCPYCSKHLADLRNVEARLEEEGFQIIALSPDRPELLSSATEQHDYGYQLMSDFTADAAVAFGLAFRVPEKTLARYRSHGLDLTARSGRRHKILPVPAAYVINRQGMIRFAYWNPDYKERIDARKLLQAAREAVR